MTQSLLVRIAGFPAALIHGDTLVLDRWFWLRALLPRVKDSSTTLLDVGCGTGAFTIGAALRGYSSLGLSWDERNQRVAGERAAICRASNARFEVCDVRNLDQRPDLSNHFDVIVCCENIEHIIDDRKLVRDMARCLKDKGILLLTTPNIGFKAMYGDTEGPYPTVETGEHVRRGYSEAGLRDLCAQAGLDVHEVGFVSGFFSQMITSLMKRLAKTHRLLAWAVVFPLRIFPPLLDPWLSPLFGWPCYCITLIAAKR